MFTLLDLAANMLEQANKAEQEDKQPKALSAIDGQDVPPRLAESRRRSDFAGAGARAQSASPAKLGMAGLA